MSVLVLILLAALIVSLAALFFLWSSAAKLKSEQRRVAALLSSSPEKLEEAAGEAAMEAARAQELSGCRSRINQLLAGYADPVLLVDQDRVILDLSASAEAGLDQPRRRRGLLESLESHELDEAARLAIDSLKPEELQVRLYAQGRRPFHVRLVPFRVDDRRECLIYLRDISTLVKYGELRSQFAATVSHELRTPLTGIRALAESLKDPEIKPEDARRFLSRIELETEQLNQLIDEILFLSSLESGVETLGGETPLAPLAEQLSGRLTPLAGKLDVRLEIHIPENLILPLNERMATTVLFNLMDNAVKYSGRGSKVKVNAAREGNSVRLTVHDDGIGIDAEHLPHIFERFYRVDKSRSRRLGGTGLGLSIVKHIVETAGGEASAVSQEGFGTEITVRLPLPS